jgi:hypothetical protein
MSPAAQVAWPEAGPGHNHRAAAPLIIAGIKRLDMLPPGTNGRSCWESVGITSPDGGCPWVQHDSTAAFACLRVLLGWDRQGREHVCCNPTHAIAFT